MSCNHSLGFIVSLTSLKMKNNLARELEPFHVTPDQWALLQRLWEQDGITQKELADKCFKDQPTTTRILNKLEGKGLIKRLADQNDRRAFLIYLTSEGRRMKDPLKVSVQRALEKALSGFSESEKTELRGLLSRIINNLSD
ncbi:MarR family winged helix-turn-helix transcriptional regulator [Cytobacillus sp. Hz8]|uniref:MarR family winged helix-turn-helix transcriptional regulator n=1 Tax=Cytobacillus sp. Hz8 TaxID=3347168 RepID=UPI0035DE797C